MKANYGKKKLNIREKSVMFRTKKDDKYSMFCIYQNNVFGNIEDDKDMVYLDFESEDQVDRLIDALTKLKDNSEENADDCEAES